MATSALARLERTEVKGENNVARMVEAHHNESETSSVDRVEIGEGTGGQDRRSWKTGQVQNSSMLQKPKEAEER